MTTGRELANAGAFPDLVTAVPFLWSLCLLLLVLQLGVAAPVRAEAGATENPASSATYHTPLAGEPGRASIFGYSVELPAIDRAHITSLTLGGSLLLPRQGRTSGVPIAAFYLRHIGDEARTRDVVSIFVNDLEYDRKVVGPVELVGRLENYTLPGTQSELAQNREVKATSVEWGNMSASLGPGLRLPVAPFEVDNEVRVQLLGNVGYFYAARSNESGPDLVLPPNTLTYGAKLRLRYDGMRRNLLELPHLGWAGGLELDYQVRDRWSALGTRQIPSRANYDYLHLNGYLVGVTGVPGLSERNRLLFSAYGGVTSDSGGDRFNAYRINGGPFSGESDDLARPHYTGIVYDDILATNYAVLSAGYRRELCFFIYLSLVGSYLWADRATGLDDGRVVFKDTDGVSATASLDFAFFGNSSFNLGYVWDSGVIRNGRSGTGVVFTWNKLF